MKVEIRIIIANLFLLFSYNSFAKANSGFIENKGQIHDQNFNPNTQVKYLLNTEGMNIQLKTNGFSYDTYVIKNLTPGHCKTNRFGKTKTSFIENTFQFHRVDIEFINSNSNPEIIAEDPCSNYSNYYTNNNGELGSTKVQSFSKITYKNLYPNIDLEFTVHNDRMKYNFILHPGANMNTIRWRYDGATKTNLNGSDIEIEINHGILKESIPESFLGNGIGKVKNVSIKYSWLSENTFGFSSSDDLTIRSNEKLIIDPTPNVLWATYFGGSAWEFLAGSVLDAAGNVYIIGYTQSSSAMATAGAFQPLYGGGSNDAILLKFNSAGVLKWSTYYGRGGDDQGTAIAIDPASNLIITGVTNSPSSMSTPGCHQFTFGAGAYDGFVAKFDTNGLRQWGTYYGGSNYDDMYGCSVDKTGNIYVCGSTASTNSISTIGSQQPTYGGGPYDNYLVKFNNNGVRQWSTYYGSNGDDGSISCASDRVGNVYMTGYTTSSLSISTLGSHQQTFGGNYDSYLLKFNANGMRQWCTYYGSDSIDVGQCVYYDTLANNIYITGYTKSTDSIATLTSHQPIYNGNTDVFLAKFDTTGIRQWGTYYGGTSYDWGFGITCDSNFVYLCGLTDSYSSISTPNSYQPNYGGGGLSGDIFLVKFNKNCVRQWGTYYGGLAYEYATSTQLDLAGNIYLVGFTGSTAMATSGAHQTALAGNQDGLCIKFDQSILTGISTVNSENEFINIYPNPTNGSCTINSNGKELSLDIFNAIGQKNRTIQLNSANNYQINLVGLETGIYCVVDSEHKTKIANKIVVVN